MSNLSSYLTKEAKEELEKELSYLTKVKRAEISDKLKECISWGDLSENAAYDEAKEQQMLLEQRIAEVEDLLTRTILSPENKETKTKVDFGSFVVLRKKGTEEAVKYQLVGSEEANPLERKISNESPLGKTLLGKKKNDTVKVLTPKGEISYTIMEIV